MRIRIHRGATEIGGNCIELEADGKRLVLDVGRPLSAGLGEDVPLPEIEGLSTGTDESFLGVVITHPHADHYGLLDTVSRRVPVYIGNAAARMLREAAFFSPVGIDLDAAGYLADRQPLEIGPFRVTPYLIDHSAFDAYSLLIEARGKRLFYTGDLRAHGRKAGRFEELVGNPPPDIDTLIMEGTQVRAESDGTERGWTEQDVERACVQTFRETKGMALSLFSPLNIDRLVTMFRACRKAGRALVLDLYGAAVAAATGYDTIPQADWEGVRVYLPRAQKSKVRRSGEFERINAVKPARIYEEEMRARAGELVMLFRGSMTRELESYGCLDEARAVWSMWPGYLENESGKGLVAWLQRMGIELVIRHASGHAFVPDLRRLVAGMSPDRLVPIHSEAGERFGELFGDLASVERREDGEWWEVG